MIAAAFHRGLGACNGAWGTNHNHVLGGSWVVISGVISPLRWVISIVTLLITVLITTHEPPCRDAPSPAARCLIRTHILRLLGPKTILYKAFELF